MHQIVPKAPDVAGHLHRFVPDGCPAPGANAALACPVSGGLCPALAALFGGLAPAGEEARAWVKALAPCSECRVAAEAGRQRLRHLRLGQREREILLAAAVADVLVVTEPGMSRSLSAARRRAAQALAKAGLVTSLAAGKGASAASARAAVALTELGRYVTAAYGRFLTAGKPIRWTRPQRGVALPGHDPAELGDAALARTEAALRQTLTDLKGVLIAAVARPVTDPARLDQVTRHLEQKATLLKAVLEPARAAGGGETGALRPSRSA